MGLTAPHVALRGKAKVGAKRGSPFTEDNAATVGKRGGHATSPAKAAAVRLNAQRARARELAERYPFLGRPHWSPPDVVTIGRLLKRLPRPEHDRVAALLDQIPPFKAVAILQKLPRKRPAERDRLYALGSSGNARDRDLALTRALDLPPPLDEATPHLQRVRDELRLAIRRIGGHEDLRERLRALQDDLVGLMKELTVRTGGHQYDDTA